MVSSRCPETPLTDLRAVSANLAAGGLISMTRLFGGAGVRVGVVRLWWLADRLIVLMVVFMGPSIRTTYEERNSSLKCPAYDFFVVRTDLRACSQAFAHPHWGSLLPVAESWVSSVSIGVSESVYEA